MEHTPVAINAVKPNCRLSVGFDIAIFLGQQNPVFFGYIKMLAQASRGKRK
jgi:hypothetical protein